MLMFYDLQKLGWCCQLWFWNFVICICIDSLLCVWLVGVLAFVLNFFHHLNLIVEIVDFYVDCHCIVLSSIVIDRSLYILITSYNPHKSLSLRHDIVVYIFYNLFHLLWTSLLAILFLFHNALFYLATLCIMAWSIVNDIIINFLQIT